MNMHAVVGILGSSNKMYDPLVTAVIDSVQCLHKDAKRRKAEREAAQKRQAEEVSRGSKMHAVCGTSVLVCEVFKHA